MNNTSNPLLCDPVTGACEMPDSSEGPAAKATAIEKPVKLIYFTDPICSSCWGIEPQLRRLKLEYGAQISVEYHMGGLLPDWSYNSGGISKPSDVAHHWDEVSRHYRMPIDGDVWLEDPLHSSYPPSIAFKAAQLQNETKALAFMRELREAVFLRKTNIAKWPAIAAAAIAAGLDTAQLRADFDGRAETLFQEDLALARSMGVRGFPSIFISSRAGKTEFIYGSKPYADYTNALHAVFPELKKTRIPTAWQDLFAHYPTMATREFAELSGRDDVAAGAELEKLTAAGKLQKLDTRNGPMWKRK